MCIRDRDYIKKPKENGYRSLHMIVLVDVYFSDHKDKVCLLYTSRCV